LDGQCFFNSIIFTMSLILTSNPSTEHFAVSLLAILK